MMRGMRLILLWTSIILSMLHLYLRGGDLAAEQVGPNSIPSQHWAYVAPQKHVVSVSEIPAAWLNWPRNWIDEFLLVRLTAEQTVPSPQADPITLCRRLYWDLIGLPPTPEEADEFVADPSEAGYQRLVDRLLQSPHFGERMAMHWLDLVRYADTVGYHGDQDHNISPYRDWVIDAFNNNMPLDEFTRDQLAGDLLPEATVDQKIATGYNRLLQTSHEGGVQPKEYLSMYAADRVRNLSAVWMGATIGCAQCHDHKYDPFTMKDFYSLAAMFADIDESNHFANGGNVIPTRRHPEISVLSRQQREEVAQLEAEIAVQKRELEDRSLAHSQSDKETLQRELDKLVARRDTIRNSTRSTMVTVAIEPRTMRILPRGNWLDESGPLVEPAVPEFLGFLEVSGRRANRLDLANWLTDTRQGIGALTARVFVNRFWYLFFGQGLAQVMDDFGGQGLPPDHPQLLDRLALELIESGWDVKSMVKLIVSSKAYRQSSGVRNNRGSEGQGVLSELESMDPENRLFARQSHYRLPAELVRDAILSISGLLVDEYGGASVKPYQPTGYYRHLNFPKRKYKQHNDRRQWRRGVYVHWQRQFLHPMLKAFDAPRREECTAERPRSNTPTAAMALLNDPSFVEAARVFAEQIIRIDDQSRTDRAGLEYAFRKAVSRSPDPEELHTLTLLLESHRRQYAKTPGAARELIAIGNAPVARDLDPVQLAAWTSVTRTILNLNETITRN